MELDQELIKAAQKWADYLINNDKWGHDNDRGNVGENLAMTMNSARDYRKDFDTTAVKRWYDEIVDYYFSSGHSKNANAIGHFTQVVWKGSTKLGCGHGSNGQKAIVCCRYSPPGNYMG